MIRDWQSSITRADMADWTTVAAYLFAALLAGRAAGHASRRSRSRERVFWRLTAVLLLFFAINELLDLQTLLTEIGRAYAKKYGWYGEHRRVQYLFVVALTVATAFAVITTLWLTRRAHVAVWLAIAGLAFIGLFVLIRAASFHHVDLILSRGAPEFTWGSVQEVVGIVIVAVAASLYARKPVDAFETGRIQSP